MVKQVEILFVGSTEDFAKAKRTPFEMIKVESRIVLLYTNIFINLFPDSEFASLYKDLVPSANNSEPGDVIEIM